MTLRFKFIIYTYVFASYRISVIAVCCLQKHCSSFNGNRMTTNFIDL